MVHSKVACRYGWVQDTVAIMLQSEDPPGTTPTSTGKAWGESGATVDHQNSHLFNIFTVAMSTHCLLPKPRVLPALPSNWAGLLVNSLTAVAVMKHLPKTT